MSPKGIVVMVFVLGFVWGGFLLLLRKAARHERRKSQEG